MMFSGAMLCLLANDPSFVTGDAGKSAAGETRGADPNVLVANRVNGDQSPTKAIQPGAKGGDTRGSYCRVVYDNWTEWYIHVYVDGYYEGGLGRWGAKTVNVGVGNTKVYAVAEFTDGSKVWWGPRTVPCYDYVDVKIYKTRYDLSYR